MYKHGQVAAIREMRGKIWPPGSRPGPGRACRCSARDRSPAARGDTGGPGPPWCKCVDLERVVQRDTGGRRHDASGKSVACAPTPPPARSATAGTPGGATRRDAEKVLGELVKRTHDGDYRSPERITVADYLTERWLPLRRRQVPHSTYHSYVANTRLHVVPYIGNIPLQRLTPDDLDGLWPGCGQARRGRLCPTGRRSGRRSPRCQSGDTSEAR